VCSRASTSCSPAPTSRSACAEEEATSSVRINPAILAADLTRLGDEARAAEGGGAAALHVDVMDGCFVPVVSFGTPIVVALRGVTPLPLDVHLQVEEPERHLADFVAAGASTLTVHVEACPHVHRALADIRSLGARAGVALNPGTPLQALDEVLDDVDVVVVMTVDPGRKELVESAIPKISRLRELLEAESLDVEIAADGGVNPATAPRLVAAGATCLIAASAAFGAPDGVAAALGRLRAAAEAGASASRAGDR
jgi:ribulose-phosphate 3-epimerase